MRILHLMHNDKFIDYIVNTFEICNHNNNIYIVGLNPKTEIVDYHQKSDVIKLEFETSEFYSIINSYEFDAVIIHYLDEAKAKLVNLIPETKKIIWFMWGADFYESGLYKKTGELFKPLTQEYLLRRRFDLLNKTLKNQLNYLLLKYLYKKSPIVKKDPAKSILETIKRIKYVATVVPDEFKIINQTLGMDAKFIKFSYASFNKIDINITDAISKKRAGYVLIGNSNTPASNHLDVLKKLKSSIENINRIIIPLNYGGDEVYKKSVIKYGTDLYGKKYLPIIDFIPIEKYKELLVQCQFAVFYHIRQQAVGNILLMLSLGAKVFLSKMSPVYKHLKNLGFLIFSVEDNLNIEEFTPFNEEQANYNGSILIKCYGTKKIYDDLEHELSDLETSK